MQGKFLKRPSPALVVAVVALFVALGGTAGAVVTAAVPLAKRALTADKAKTALVAENAKKLGGQTGSQIVSQAASQAVSQASSAPGPASTAAALIVMKSLALGQITTGQFREGSLACDSGQKVMGGGLSSDGAVVMLDSFPANETTWQVSGVNLGSGAANVSVWATCLK